MGVSHADIPHAAAGDENAVEAARAGGVRRPRLLVCMGDANSPATFSGTPYHLLQAARRLGLFDRGLTLRPHARAFRLRRAAWNAGRLLRGEDPRGYQHAAGFLESLWAPLRGELAGAAVVNTFQLYPPSVVADDRVEKWYYVDGTLKQLFEYYDYKVGRSIARDSITRERAGYHAAAGVVTMSAFAADSVVRDYGVPRERVHVVTPGANLTLEEHAAWERSQSGLRDAETGLRLARGGGDGAEPAALRLAFVGKYWDRKGLDRLLRALRLGRPRGLRATLRVLGCPRESLPPDLRDVDGVEWLGFVPRRPDGQRLFRLLAECDVGCLLSRAEFSSIALREYLALGMVVLGPLTGGCPELMEPSASVAIRPEATDEEIADVLLGWERDPARFAELRAAAWAHRRDALWEASVRRFPPALWAGGAPAT